MLVHVIFEHATQSITYTIFAVNVHVSISVSFYIFHSTLSPLGFVGRLWLSIASDVGGIRSAAIIYLFCPSHLYLGNSIASSILRELDKIVFATAVNFIFQSLMGRFFTTVNSTAKLPIECGVTHNI